MFAHLTTNARDRNTHFNAFTCVETAVDFCSYNTKPANKNDTLQLHQHTAAAAARVKSQKNISANV